MKVLILEDSPERNIAFTNALMRHNLTIATSVFSPRGATHYLADGGPYDLLLLDHDLGTVNPHTLEEETGADFANYLATQDFETKPQIIIHSWNPEGAENMKIVLEAAGFPVTVQPFGLTLLKGLEGL